MFGRTSQIRTGDLYHVKAVWPHQDTRGRIKSSVIARPDQGLCNDHLRRFLSRPATRSTRKLQWRRYRCPMPVTIGTAGLASAL